MLKIDLQLFGGRGASSGSAGGGKGAARRTQKEHPDPWHEPPSLGEQLANQNGVDIAEAQAQVYAVEDFSGSDYRDIRYAQYIGITTSDAYKKAQTIETFIEQSPTWDGGDLYRGIRMKADDVAQLQVGGTIDMRGMSSWSSKESVATSFAHTYGGGSRKSVIFRTSGTKKGTSIRHLSQYSHEDEVLVSGKATWTIKNIRTSFGVTYVDVIEN
jgi:hypothetical protein